jgi:hypothetical protein
VLAAISNRNFFAGLGGLAGLALALSCSRSAPSERTSSVPPRSSSSSLLNDAAPAPNAPPPRAVAPLPASSAAPPVSAAPRSVDGPHTLALAPGRAIFYALPGEPPRPGPRPFRLVAHLHGICHPPAYSCGRWLGAAVDVGALVCPTGNARCGDASVGPPSWEAPSWSELVNVMDTDLERSIATIEAKHPGTIRREGAVLTGWSRGAFAAPVIARNHPGRWPYLVLVEANVPLSAASLRKAGVRAVALLAGERGTEIAGERKTQAELEKEGFAAKLFVMRGVAHLYPDDMDRLMGEALEYVLAASPTEPTDGGSEAGELAGRDAGVVAPR